MSSEITKKEIIKNISDKICLLCYISNALVDGRLSNKAKRKKVMEALDEPIKELKKLEEYFINNN